MPAHERSAAATAGRTEFTFDSADGRSQVRAVLWVPLSMERADAAFGEPELGCFKPRGVVQLVHGMAEHIDRYDDFARFLADAGYLVAGHDHIGHGDTAGAPERRGVIGAEGGADAMIEDAETAAPARLPAGGVLARRTSSSGIPWARSCCAAICRATGQGLAGAVICGTADEACRRLPRRQPGRPGHRGACAATATAAGLLHALADGAYSRAITGRPHPLRLALPRPGRGRRVHGRRGVRLHVRCRRLRHPNRAGLARRRAGDLGRDTPHDSAPALRGRRRRPRRQMRHALSLPPPSPWRPPAPRTSPSRLFPGMRHEILERARQSKKSTISS